MKAYINSIIIVSLVSSILSALLSSSKSSLKKYLNFISGLICAIILLTPVVNIVNNASVLSNGIENVINSLDITDKIQYSNKIIIEEGTEKICNGVKDAIISKYNFKSESVEITAKINDSDIQAVLLEEITVTLKNEATWTDEEQVRNYVEDLVGCSVQVKKI